MKFEHYAARFAAKHAVLQAFAPRVQRAWMRGIEIGRDAFGKPTVTLSGDLRKILRVSERCRIEISMAHERRVAVAAVLAFWPGK